MGGADLLALPATLMIDVVYCLLLEERKERAEHRAELDRKLDSMEKGLGGKPDRDTWGKLPHQQAAMRAGMTA